MAGGRWAHSALAVLILCGTEDAAADQRAMFVVHIENHVRMPAEDLDVVKHEVEAIFRAADIEVRWAGPWYRPMSEAPCDGLRHLSVAIIDIQEPFAGSAQDTADVLGRAAAHLGRTWLFANRIADAARARAEKPNVLLGYAVAHELGHLLLPGNGAHSTAGIMRPSLDGKVGGPLRFTSDEAQSIRASLAEAQTKRQCAQPKACK